MLWESVLFDEGDPVLVGVGGGESEGVGAGALEGGDGAALKRAAVAGVEPGDGEGGVAVAEVEAGGFCGIFDEEEVGVAGFGQAEAGGVEEEVIEAFHFGGGELLGAEEVEGVSALVPKFVAGAPVLTGEVGVFVLVAEVEFEPPAAGEEVAPEGVHAGVIVGGIFGVGDEGVFGVAGFIASDDPGFALGLGGVDDVEGGIVDVGEGGVGGLQGGAIDGGVFAVEVGGPLSVVDDDGVVVGVVGVEVVAHGEALGGGLEVGFVVVGFPLAVFFAEVPVEGGVVAEAGEEFAVVELALASGVALIEEGFVFAFLGFEVEEEAFGGGVFEDDFPLGEARDVEAFAFVVVEIREDVLVVAFDIEGEEGHGVEAFGREVVDGADHAFALAVLPGGVALFPVADVGLPGFDEVVFFAVVFEIAIEVGIGEEVFGGVGADFPKDVAGAGADGVAVADGLHGSEGAGIRRGFIAGGDGEAAAFAIEEFGAFTGGGVGRDGDVLAFAEVGFPGPVAAAIGGELDVPLVSGFSGGVGGPAIGCEVSGDGEGLIGVGEGDIEPVVGEGVGGGVFGGVGAVEAEGDLVPDFLFAGDFRSGEGSGDEESGEEECEW